MLFKKIEAKLLYTYSFRYLNNRDNLLVNVFY